MSEASLILLAAAGDSQAFAEIVRRRHRFVRNFLYYLCRHPSERDDLAQQVFLTAWRSIRDLRTPDAFDSWLRKIMVTTWLEALRRNRLPYADESKLPERGTDSESPAEQVDLNTALGQLPSAMRLCVVLAYHAGLTHEEIASLTAIPLGTVKSNILRGTARLRELLADYRCEA